MQTMSNLFENNGAHFSECRKYRFALWRIWDRTKPAVMFIGLNPSTANEASDDPTIRRVISFARKWGHGGVYMMNCFPFVSADPSVLRANVLRAFHEPLIAGYYTGNHIRMREIGGLCSRIVFAWGSFPLVREFRRDAELAETFPDAQALVMNANGSPRHPLYVPGDVVPVKYDQHGNQTT